MRRARPRALTRPLCADRFATNPSRATRAARPPPPLSNHRLPRPLVRVPVHPVSYELDFHSGISS